MPRLMPVLAVRGGAQAVDFYRRAFGADERSRVTAADGSVVAVLDIAGWPLMVADESPEHGNPSPEGLGGTTVRLALVVPDPDAAAARAVAAGARLVYAVADQDYGWRLGRVVDPFGHHWEIGRPLREAAAPH
jgi:PhnB protein